MALDNREKRFAIEYVKNGRNATQAALAAKYSESTARHASDWLSQTTQNNARKSLPYKPELVIEINRLTNETQKEGIIDAQGVMRLFVEIAEKEDEETRDRLRALENIGKILGMYETSSNMRVKVESDGFIDALKGQAANVFKGADIEE